MTTTRDLRPHSFINKALALSNQTRTKKMASVSSVEIDTVMRGYHVYKEVWTSTLGEKLTCRRESDNFHDRFAVAVIKGSDIVGHVPKKISSVCSLFLRRSGTITCKVTGNRQHSADLDQGGLEVPCKLSFACNDEPRLATTRKLLDLALKRDNESEMPLKKVKLEPVEEVTVDESWLNCDTKSDLNGNEANKMRKEDQECSISLDYSAILKTQHVKVDQEWVKTGRTRLLASHRIMILSGEELDDAILTFAQKLLKKQFPSIGGLLNPLLQEKKKLKGSQCLQLIHSRQNHWIVASTVDEVLDKVMVYDSLYDDVDDRTQTIIRKLFGATVVPEIAKIHKQQGVRDCGLFAIAFATAICFKQSISEPFKQDVMRQHLVQCFEKGACLPFPLVHKP